MDAVVTTLRTVSLFADLPREVLARLVSEFDELDVAAGQTVFSQGDPGDALYVIASGAVEVRRERDGRSERVAVLGPGDCLGEMALVTGDPRSATVVTLSATRLLRLDKERFQVLSDRQPAFFRELARVLCSRIARTSADVAHARRAYTTVFDTILDGAEPPARRLLEVLAVAKRADAGVLIATPGANGPRIATEVAAHHPALVFQDERGRYELHPEFRDHVRRRLADANGTDATHDLHVAVATAHGDEEAWAKGARGTGWPRAAGTRRRTRSARRWRPALRRRTRSSRPGSTASPRTCSSRPTSGLPRRASSSGRDARTPRARSSSARSRDSGWTASRATGSCGAWAPSTRSRAGRGVWRAARSARHALPRR